MLHYLRHTLSISTAMLRPKTASERNTENMEMPSLILDDLGDI